MSPDHVTGLAFFAVPSPHRSLFPPSLGFLRSPATTSVFRSDCDFDFSVSQKPCSKDEQGFCRRANDSSSISSFGEIAALTLRPRSVGIGTHAPSILEKSFDFTQDTPGLSDGLAPPFRAKPGEPFSQFRFYSEHPIALDDVLSFLKYCSFLRKSGRFPRSDTDAGPLFLKC